MPLILNRRGMLKSATTMAMASSLPGVIPTDVRAAEIERGGKLARGHINQIFQEAVTRKAVEGVVAMAATDDGIIYEGAFGKRDRAGAPMSSDAIFWLLSMTKAVTAAACMQLVEQGKLRLDQPAGDILPELAAPQVLEGFDTVDRPKLRPAKRPITLRHLLTHTSGFTYSGWSEALTRYEKATGMPDIAFSKNGAFQAPLEFDPGDLWQYGISMDWVGKIIEAVADQSLEIYFRENIFAPLGMTDSGFLISNAQRRRVATMYNRRGDDSLAPAPFEISQRPEFFMGGGGLFSTPRDYMALLQMLLRRGTFRGARILKPETVALMFQNQIGELRVTEMKTAAPAYSHDFDQFPGMEHKWGLSFDINTKAGPNGRTAGSLSWGGLLNCYYWLDPTKRVTGTLFTQVLPFFDPDILAIYGAFERSLYAELGRT
jgi:methyl acetate hydrolase